MAKLFIEDTSLVAIGDAIRSKGSTVETVSLPLIYGSNNVDADGNTTGESCKYDLFSVVVTIPGASKIKAYVKWCLVSREDGYILNINETSKFYGNGSKREETRTYDGDTITINARSAFGGSQYFYYFKIYGLDASGAEMTSYEVVSGDTKTYSPAEMAEAIRALPTSSGGITPEGELEITENGTYDVTEYASAAVNVPTGIFPEGTQHITENGTYNIAQYENVLVEVASSSGGDSEDSDLLMWLVENDGYTDAKKEGFYNDKFTRIGDYAFYFKPIAGTIELPNVTLIGSYSFASMSMYKFTKFIAPKLTSIGAYAFNQSPYLENIEAENVEEIYSNVFQGCTALKEVKFPKITSIGSNAFRSCSSLTKVDLGSNMTSSILTRTFNACSNLTALILRNADTIVGLGATNAFDSTPIVSGTGYIYVPRALISTYKTASNWSNYAAQFRAIEDYPEICG